MPALYTRLRAHVTFANVVSLAALFVALGGSAYAVGALPVNSVGRPQIQANAITTSKLAPNSVGTSKLKPSSVTSGELGPGSVDLQSLDPTVREQLTLRPQTGRPGRPGASGPPGPVGPTGPAGAPGPSAARVVFDAHASTTPTQQTILDVAGLQMNAECEAVGSGVQLNLSITAAEAGTGVENIDVDSGTGTPSFAEAHAANLQIDLPAGTTVLGGPSAANGEYSRILAHLIYVSPKSTVDLSVALVLDGTAETCEVNGVGVPATS
jgi:hypothetical protein